MARALANECSHGDTKVSFFMRKGADCLSKWVGESERQLRLLFDQVSMIVAGVMASHQISGRPPHFRSRSRKPMSLFLHFGNRLGYFFDYVECQG